MSQSETPKIRRVSPIYLAIILVILILSITALYQAMSAYFSFPPRSREGTYYLTMGVIGLAASTYMLYRTRMVAPQATIELPRVSTTILCEKCGFKNIREFERGDFIFKEMGPCPKCEEKMIIASVYREVKEEDKE